MTGLLELLAIAAVCAAVVWALRPPDHRSTYRRTKGERHE